MSGLETMKLEGRVTWLGETMPFQLIKQSSNRMRLTLFADSSESIYAFDGQSFWQATAGETEGEVDYSLVSESDEERFFECRRFFEPLMSYALRGEGTLQVIEFGEWQGRTAIRVQIRGADYSRIDVFLDPQSLRVRGLIERVRSGGAERMVAFDDFRKINGCYIPFSRQVSIGGELIYEMEVASCRINLDAGLSLFEPPQELLKQSQ